MIPFAAIKENIKNNKLKTIVAIFLICVFILYAVSFVIINFKGFARLSNGDLYADTLISRMMWEQKTLFPDGWMFGNQYYIIATPVLSALFYGITGSMNLSIAIATTIMSIVIFITYYWMLKPYLSKFWIFVSSLVLISCTLSYDLAGDKNSMAQLFFLLGSYYSCYLITAFVVWGNYTHGIMNKDSKVLSVSLIIGIMLSFFTGMQSIRQTAVMVCPMIAFEIIKTIYNWITKKDKKFDGKSILRVALFSVANFLGLIVMRIIKVPSVSRYGSLKVLSLKEILSTILTKTATLRNVTGRMLYKTYEPVWFCYLFSACVALIVILAFVKILIMQKNMKTKDKGLVILIVMCLLSLAIVYVGSVFIDIEMREIYYFIWTVLLSISVTFVIKNEKKAIRTIIVSIMSVVIIMNYAFSYWPNIIISLDKEATEEEQIADYILDNGYKYVYGTWWSASRVAAVSDGKIIAGLCTDMKVIDKKTYLGTFIIYECTNIQNIYSEPDNNSAVYLIEDIEDEHARECAKEVGAELTLLFEAESGELKLYKSSKQLMHFGSQF